MLVRNRIRIARRLHRRFNTPKMPANNFDGHANITNAFSACRPMDCGHPKVRCRTLRSISPQKWDFAGSERMKACLAALLVLDLDAMLKESRQMLPSFIRLYE